MASVEVRPKASRPDGGRSSASRDAMTRAPRRHLSIHRRGLERAAAHYLHDRCYERRSAARVSDFAQYLELTAPYLSRIASEVLGMSLRDFLRKQQLERAAQLLRIGMDIPEVALRAGFGTVSTLYRWFHIGFGMTPGEFRARL